MNSFRYCLFIVLNFTLLTSNAQIQLDPIDEGDPSMTFSGPASVRQQEQHEYRVWVGDGDHRSTSYVVSGGIIVSQSKTKVSVRWTSIGSNRYVRARIRINGNYYIRYQYVTVSCQSLNPGLIGGSQVVCYSGDPEPFMNVRSASGGNGSYSYRWQYRVLNASTWKDVSGATGPSFDPPNHLFNDYEYRRKVTSCGQTGYSNIVTYIGLHRVYPGRLTTSKTTVCFNEDAPNIWPAEHAAEGDGTYQYQWYYRTIGDWIEIGGATGTAYNPGRLTSSTSFRRSVTSCGETRSTIIRINVQGSELQPGSIGNPQTVCYNGNPLALTHVTFPTRGPAPYSYQWQKRTLTGSWQDITNAVDLTYDPPNLLETTIYRRKEMTSCGEQVKYSNEVIITVEGDLQPGQIAGNQVLCSYEDPAPLTNVSGASQGNGIYTYQWQSRKPGSSIWETLVSERGFDYDPPVLNETTEYRRLVTSCLATKASNVIVVDLLENPSTPVIAIQSQTLEGVMLVSTSPADETYYWQIDEDGQNETNSSNTLFINKQGRYYLRAKKQNGCWGNAGFMDFRAKEPILQVNALSSESILVSWTETLGNETGYIIHKSPTAGGPYQEIQIPASQTEFLDQGLATGTRYFYRIQSKVGTQRSTALQEISAITTSEFNGNRALNHLPLSNGSISAIRWKNVNDENVQLYTYVYDGLNRLKHAQYAAKAGNTYEKDKGYYSIPLLDYDLNGNITRLTRQGRNAANNADIIDELYYEYGVGSDRSNQLTKVMDQRGESGFKDDHKGSEDYVYDANGNLVKDLNKGIDTIIYNHLNLPTHVVKNTDDFLSYTYDASGVKLSERVEKYETLSLTDVNWHTEWEGFNGTIVPHQNNIGGRNDVVKFYANNVNTQHVFRSFPEEMRGKRVKFTADVYLPSSNTNVTGFLLWLSPSISTVNTTTDQWVTVTYETEVSDATHAYAGIFLNNKNTSFVAANNPNDDYIYIDNLSLKAMSYEKTRKYVNEFLYENDTLQLIQHEEGRIVFDPITGAPNYEYHLKDHLGNIRVTFSTTPENYEMVEDFEGGANGFQNLHRHTHGSANTTSGGDEVALLQAGQTGALVLLSLNKGDTIGLSVQANYEAAPSGNTFLATGYNVLFESFDQAFGGIEGIVASADAFNYAISGANMVGKDEMNAAPRAFLNYIWFDRSMNYVAGGFEQISTASQGVGVHETVAIDAFMADREGYLLAYLSNENQEAVNVHFDDFTVYHGKTNVVQSEAYYPFGGQFKSYARTASIPQRYLYNGKEKIEEVNWYDYGARMYDPWLGRWNTIDPMASSYYAHTPYNYVLNQPTQAIDPDGMECVGCREDEASESDNKSTDSDESTNNSGCPNCDEIEAQLAKLSSGKEVPSDNFGFNPIKGARVKAEKEKSDRLEAQVNYLLFLSLFSPEKAQSLLNSSKSSDGLGWLKAADFIDNITGGALKGIPGFLGMLSSKKSFQERVADFSKFGLGQHITGFGELTFLIDLTSGLGEMQFNSTMDRGIHVFESNGDHRSASMLKRFKKDPKEMIKYMNFVKEVNTSRSK